MLFHRFNYPNIPFRLASMLTDLPHQTPTATWQDVARAWNAAREVYLRSHQKREWRELMECGNRGEVSFVPNFFHFPLSGLPLPRYTLKLTLCEGQRLSARLSWTFSARLSRTLTESQLRS